MPALVFLVLGIILLTVFLVISFVIWELWTSPAPAGPQRSKGRCWAYVGYGAGGVLALLLGLLSLCYWVASWSKPMAQFFSGTPAPKDSPTDNCHYNGKDIVPCTSDYFVVGGCETVSNFYVCAPSLDHNSLMLETGSDKYVFAHLCCQGLNMTFKPVVSTKEHWERDKKDWVVCPSKKTWSECVEYMKKMTVKGHHYLAKVNDCSDYASMFSNFLSSTNVQVL